jgi:hypothetical protein
MKIYHLRLIELRGYISYSDRSPADGSWCVVAASSGTGEKARGSTHPHLHLYSWLLLTRMHNDLYSEGLLLELGARDKWLPSPKPFSLALSVQERNLCPFLSLFFYLDGVLFMCNW